MTDHTELFALLKYKYRLSDTVYEEIVTRFAEADEAENKLEAAQENYVDVFLKLEAARKLLGRAWDVIDAYVDCDKHASAKQVRDNIANAIKKG